jgi:surface protein
MAVQFPDPNVTTTYTNPDTGEVYNWHPISGGWRREQNASGGSLPDPNDPNQQPGTLDDRYVNISGDTMTGPLVQHPASGTLPSTKGDLATNTPADNRLEFRYRGQDDKVRCVTLPLDCCQTVSTRTQIGIGASVQGTAEEGDVLTIIAHAVIDPTAAIDETYWERETATGSLVFETIAGETGQTYTITADDVGKRIRAVEVFLKGDDCEKEVKSNVVVILGAPTPGAPPTPEGLMFEWSAGATLNITIGRSDPSANTIIHKLNSTSGEYEEHEVVPFYSQNVTYTGGADTYGHYIVEKTGVNYVAFVGSSTTTEILLDERSYMDNLTFAQEMFSGLYEFNQDLDWWDGTGVTSWARCFKDCRKFDGKVDTLVSDQATNIVSMFEGASVFNKPVNSWDVSNATSFQKVFAKAAKFDQPVDNWNTGKGGNFYQMFYGAKEFNQPVGTWNTGSATNMRFMFRDTGAFNQPVNTWNTSNVSTFNSMFWNAAAFNCDITSWSLKQNVDINYLFIETGSYNQPLVGLDIGNVKSLEGVFQEAAAFNQPLDNWNTSNVSNLHHTFRGSNCAYNQPLNNWNTSNVTDLSGTFEGNGTFNRDIGQWDMSNVTTMNKTFNGTVAFNQDISGWDTGSCSDMVGMFYNNKEFLQDISTWCVKLIPLKPDGFDTSAKDGFRNVDDIQPQWNTCPPRVLTNPVIQ